MDDLDFAIVSQFMRPQSFQWDVRLSYAEIGRAAGCDEETARARLRKLEDRGAIRGWRTLPNPGLFARNWTCFELPPVPAESARKVEDALRAFDGAHLLMEALGGQFILVNYQAPGPATDRHAALLSAIAGGPTRVIPTRVPAPRAELDRKDWRVVQAIRDQPRASYEEVAAAVEASERTVRRRVERMVEGRALIHDVDLDFARMDGAVAATIYVAFREGAPRPEILRALTALPRPLFRELEGPRVRVAFAATSVPAAEAARRSIEALAEGRADVGLQLMIRRDCLAEWLDAEIAARAAP